MQQVQGDAREGEARRGGKCVKGRDRGGVRGKGQRGWCLEGKRQRSAAFEEVRRDGVLGGEVREGEIDVCKGRGKGCVCYRER